VHLGRLGYGSGVEEHYGMVPQWVSRGGGGKELQRGQGHFAFVDRHQRLGYGELRMKTLH
jgi:hypothetical protein